MAQKNTKTIVITGTHHTPALELIKQLRNDPQIDWQIHYIGNIYPSETHILHALMPSLRNNFHALDCGKFDRRFLSNTIKGIPKTIVAFFEANRLIKRIKPDIVISFGGYVSVPVIVIASFHKIPTITHEQTLTNSLSTKINSYFVNKIALSFNNTNQKKSLPSAKVVTTGNLIRSDIYLNSTKTFSHLEKFLKQKPLLYITGGNQGSRTVNDLILDILPDLLNKFTIIHQVGSVNFPDIKKRTVGLSGYFPVEYVGAQDIGWIFHHSAIIVSRSGANTCQEIVLFHKPVIFIPLPYTQQNEQFLNAKWVKNNQPDRTIILDQFTLTSSELLTQIDKLSHKKITLEPVAAEINLNLLKLIHEIA
ncbi:MAG TPA: glycosyltransferase [Patescibacteria group bacterium]